MIDWKIVGCLRLQEEELDKLMKIDNLDTLEGELDITESAEDVDVDCFDTIVFIDI